MSYLLDTHTFIWFINGDLSLPKKVINEIKNPKNQCFISIAIEFLDENQIEILPITFNHIVTLNELEFHHRDPFDRILLAQAITEGLTILSKDKNFTLYNANVFW